MDYKKLAVLGLTTFALVTTQANASENTDLQNNKTTVIESSFDTESGIISRSSFDTESGIISRSSFDTESGIISRSSFDTESGIISRG